MKKKTEEELNAWRFQYPTAIVSMRIVGDAVYARQFMGEGKSLLYSVINAMRFNKLGQFQDERRYPDGTIVRAKSVFGQNIVEIDVSKSSVAVAVAATCTITLIDVSHFVQPMQFPGEIHIGEVENLDYLKIYYAVDISNCVNCADIKWEVKTKECIYSLENSCWGQIVESSYDDQGKFILVKFFTENMTFSRTGLSKMNLKGWIEKPDGSEACKAEKAIQVDCCEKATGDPTNRENPNNREVVILVEKETIERWKEGCEDRGDCEIYERCKEYWDWCEVPPELPPDALQEETSFRARPEEKVYEEGQEKPPGDGSCLPYVWELNGSGTIEERGDFKESMTYTPPTPFGCGEITISVKDRCETIKQTHRDCCKTAPTLSIEYTSLVMWCNASQTLTSVGGCKPYGWSLTPDFGTLTPSGNGLTAIYKAPTLNPDCISPTITLTDCCGNTANITIRINCSSEWVQRYRWVYAGWGNHWYVYTDLIDCETGELVSTSYTTEFTLPPGSSPPITTPFCVEEGDLSACQPGYYYLNSPYCNGCEYKPEGCCPPD